MMLISGLWYVWTYACASGEPGLIFSGKQLIMRLLSRIVANTVTDVLENFKPDIVLYDAGVDPHRDDPLGRLCLSDSGLLRRDLLVRKVCWLLYLFHGKIAFCWALWSPDSLNECIGDRLVPCARHPYCRMHWRWLRQWCAKSCFTPLHSCKGSYTDVDRLQALMMIPLFSITYSGYQQSWSRFWCILWFYGYQFDQHISCSLDPRE